MYEALEITRPERMVSSLWSLAGWSPTSHMGHV